jgi:hypothetical protein
MNEYSQVHEELNMATKKKYKQLRATPNRPDDVRAAEALANYARCNNSFVVDIFQVRSSLFFYSVRIRDKHPGSDFFPGGIFFVFFLIIIRYFCFEFFVYSQF